MVSSGIGIDSLHNKMGKFFFIVAIGYCLIADIGLKADKWYSREVEFSDWRGIPPVDYSTNAPLSTWYSGHPAKYFRVENLKRVLAEPDTVTIGIDYYGLYSNACNVASSFHFQWAIDSVSNGGVLVAKCYKGKLIVERKKSEN
jgi:hypothetical protein